MAWYFTMQMQEIVGNIGAAKAPKRRTGENPVCDVVNVHMPLFRSDTDSIQKGV